MLPRPPSSTPMIVQGIRKYTNDHGDNIVGNLATSGQI